MSSEELKKRGGLRKRILGAIILFALTVIFLPLFFDYVPHNIYLPQGSTAPEESKVLALTPANFDNPVAVEAASIPAAAWSVQVIQTEVAPQKLLKELMQAGYPAYLHNTNEVLIGPETNKKKLAQWVQECQKKAWKTALVAYEPGQ
jgi:cell division septation protein DedD